MKYLPLFLILVCSLCFGETNKEYSYKAFPYHGVSFKDKKAEDFNNTTIIGSCFYQEWVEGDKEVVKDIFPNGMTGVTFEKCNLDNILIPIGNTVIGGCHRKIKVQNDGEDWFLDDSLKPVRPMTEQFYDEFGISKDPKDIPIVKKSINIIEEKQRELDETSIVNP